MGCKTLTKSIFRFLTSALFLSVFVLGYIPLGHAQSTTDSGSKFCFCHNIDPAIPNSGSDNCTSFSAFDEFKDSPTAHFQHYLCDVCTDLGSNACADNPDLRGCDSCGEVVQDSCSVLDDTGMCNGCGNAIQDPGEECDDGNNLNGDGCSEDCKVVCQSDADCNDNRSCSVDTCNTETGQCLHNVDACECTMDADCDDGNVCTEDICGLDETCDNQPLTNDICDNGVLRPGENGGGGSHVFEGSGSCALSSVATLTPEAFGNTFGILGLWLLPMFLGVLRFFKGRK